MHTAAGQGVEISRQRRHEGLALARAHLRDAPLVEGDPADQLHVEMAHVLGAPGRLTHRRKSFREQVVQAGALRQPLLQPARGGLEFLVGNLEQVGLERVDPGHDLAHPLELSSVLGAENFLEHVLSPGCRMRNRRQFTLIRPQSAGDDRFIR